MTKGTLQMWWSSRSWDWENVLEYPKWHHVSLRDKQKPEWEELSGREERGQKAAWCCPKCKGSGRPPKLQSRRGFSPGAASGVRSACRRLDSRPAKPTQPWETYKRQEHIPKYTFLDVSALRHKLPFQSFFYSRHKIVFLFLLYPAWALTPAQII